MIKLVAYYPKGKSQTEYFYRDDYPGIAQFYMENKKADAIGVNP